MVQPGQTQVLARVDSRQPASVNRLTAMSAIMKYTYSIFADYHQFYLWDRDTSPGAPTDYTDADIERRIKTAPNVVVVQPERNMDVPVTLEVFAMEPETDFDEWDHVAEASLELPSGHLEIRECTGGSIGRIDLSPGTYRVRAYFGALSELSEDGLEGKDHYRLVLWPEVFSPVEVLKQFPGRNAG